MITVFDQEREQDCLRGSRGSKERLKGSEMAALISAAVAVACFPVPELPTFPPFRSLAILESACGHGRKYGWLLRQAANTAALQPVTSGTPGL